MIPVLLGPLHDHSRANAGSLHAGQSNLALFKQGVVYVGGGSGMRVEKE
jgi:hypothetical protein